MTLHVKPRKLGPDVGFTRIGREGNDSEGERLLSEVPC
jgi:hypothetical protein